MIPSSAPSGRARFRSPCSHAPDGFYLHKLGFEKRADFPYGEGSRWIEVAPPGASNTIALVPASEGKCGRRDEARCAFHTADIEADHATLRAASVDVDAEIARKGTHRSGLVSLDVTINDPFPPQFFFETPKATGS